MLIETQGNIELLKEQIRDLTDAKADVVVVYHVTIVAIGYVLFYALQGVQLFETMQTRLLH